MKKLLLLLTLASVTQLTFAQNVPSYVPSDGLVGYWGFNGNADDQSGNGLNGTVNGAILTTDRFGNSNSSYSFANGNQFISIPAALPNTFVNSMTYSLWYKEIPNADYVNIFNASGKPLVLSPSASSIRANDGNTFGVDASSPLLKVNNWKHICVVYQGQNISIYINGNLIKSDTTGFSAIIQYLSSQSIVGSTYLMGGQYPYTGLIDDIGIWNRALTQQEITNIYNGVTYSDTCNAVSGSLTNGLVGYWPFCGNANDDSGNGHNGTVNGATLTTDRFGNTNSAYFFDGLNDEISANVNLPQSLTVSCWIKSQFTTNDFPTFFDFHSSLPNYPWVFYAQASYNTNIFSRYVTLDNTSSPVFSDNVNSNGLSLNNWQYVTVVVDLATNKHKLYVNGVLTNENTFQGTLRFADIITFGSQGENADHIANFHGTLDDIGIWNRALSQQEITQLYNQNQCITNITVTDTLVINVGQLSYTNPIFYANNITLYPNPANTQVNISFTNITDLTGGQIKIINSLGQQVATTPITLSGTNTTMPLTTWGGAGLYFVQIINSQGQIVDIKKIILQ